MSLKKASLHIDKEAQKLISNFSSAGFTRRTATGCLRQYTIFSINSFILTYKQAPVKGFSEIIRKFLQGLLLRQGPLLLSVLRSSGTDL